MPRPVFLYGTLRDPAILARQSGRRRLVRTQVAARARGFRVARLRGTPYPTLVPHADGLVDGVLIRPDPAAMARLRAYEGRLYALRPLRVGTARGAVLARAWMAPRWMGTGDWTFGPDPGRPESPAPPDPDDAGPRTGGVGRLGT